MTEPAERTDPTERSILKGGPRSRRVYWTRDLEGNPTGFAAGYERTSQFVAVGAVYSYLPPKDQHLGDYSARIWLWRGETK